MLNITHLKKSYDKKTVISDLSIQVNAGDILGFIGGNGAGKTTTIKAVVGIHDFDDGQITIDGHDIQEDPLACKRSLAYVPDNPDLYEYLTGIQYLEFIADIFQVPKDKRETRIKEYSQLFEIEHALTDIISSYSHGMKQKLALISAFIHSPKLIILDEPFVGLDPKAAFTLKAVMRDFVKNGGSIFFSTHVLEVAEKLCTQLAILKDGQIIAQGKTEDIIGKQSLESFFMEVSNGE